MNLRRFAFLLAACFAGALLNQTARAADKTPQVPYPAAAKAKNEYGSLSLTIVFGRDGVVKSVEITNPSAKTKELEDGTRAFISKNWTAPSLANSTQTTVMHFNPPGAGGKKGQSAAADQKPNVPYPAQAAELARAVQLKVSVTYNADGTVKSAHVMSTTSANFGNSMDNIYFTRQAVSFIKANWVVPSEAGSTQTETVNMSP